MRTVSRTRVVVVVGKRPRRSAAEALADVEPGQEAAVFVLGLDPSTAQRRLAAEAVSLATERRFALTAELIPRPAWLGDRIRSDDDVRVLAGSRETRRWRIGSDRGVSPADA
jgi:hypothetical protein